jgi:SAM-dependent methyltransferase
MDALRRLYLRVVVPPNPFRFDQRLDHLVRQLCCSASSETWVLNLGSGSTTYGARTLNLDVQPFKGVQIRGDGQRLPFRDASLSGAVIRGVLEHVRSADEVRNELLRVLAPGAFLYIEVPFLQPVHLSPKDYRRFTLAGLREFLAAFEHVDSGVQIGPGSTLAWVLREALACLLAFGSTRAYSRLLTVVGWLTFWLKYLDVLIVSAPHVANSASALYFLGRQRG